MAEKEVPAMVMGAGSIVDAGNCFIIYSARCKFYCISGLNPEMAKSATAEKLMWSPGCGSLTEISYAERAWR